MISIHSFILLIGILQGLILVPALFFRSTNRAANRLLALLSLIFSLILLNVYFIKINLYLRYPHLLLLVMPLYFLTGPLLYFYTLFLTRTRNTLQRSDLAHMLLFGLICLIFFPYYLKPGYEKIIDYAVFAPWIRAALYLHAAQSMVYIYFTYRVVRNYQRRIATVFSQIERINLNWLKIFLSCCAVLLAIHFIELLADNIFNWDSSYSTYGVIITIYLIGYWSMRQYPIENIQASDAPPSGEKDESSRSRFEDGTVEQKLERLLRHMELKKPYLEPSLNLNQLADSLQLSPHNLSYIINARLNKNFYHFINHYRVEEVKRALADQRQAKADLLEIAFTAGFNTKATFNTIFKTYTGLTPSAYRRQSQNPATSLP